jgi:predicted nucleotidyltransferase
MGDILGFGKQLVENIVKFYRPMIIPENAVVLTREELEKKTVPIEMYDLAKAFHDEKCAEFEKLCYDYNKLKRDFEYNLVQERKQTRKETAEKFAGRLKAMAYQSTDWSHGEHPMVVEVDYIDEICEEIVEGKV